MTSSHTATAYIGLGSNQNHPLRQITAAIELVSLSANIKLVKRSSIYRSKPLTQRFQDADNPNQAYAPTKQADYLNAVIKITTQLSPLALLSTLKGIEKKQGRLLAANVWGAPRPIDLDILLYDKLVINGSSLTLPHYGIAERPFVFYPLAEIEPNLVLPNGVSIAELAGHPCTLERINTQEIGATV